MLIHIKGGFSWKKIKLTSLVGNEGEVRVTVFAVSTNNSAIIELVGQEELLGVVVAVDVDLHESVVGGGFLVALGDTGLEPGQKEPQAVPLLNLGDQLLDGAKIAHSHHQVLHVLLIAVDIQQCAHHSRGVDGIDLLYIGLNELEHVVLVQELSQILNKVETIAHNDQRQLIAQSRILIKIIIRLRLSEN